MGKKKNHNKKPVRTAAAVSTATTSKDDKEGEESSEDVPKIDDLYISKADMSRIVNYIRTTNKSFASLGNSVIDGFADRCSMGICQALVSLYEEDSTDKDDAIRRLNIIYIVWRLPELERAMRIKPQKNLNDIHNHMFATFLFYVEKSDLIVEANLAKMIISNNVGLVEKLTAADFLINWQNFAKKDAILANRDLFEKWEQENTTHWPNFLEDSVSLSYCMRQRGFGREDYESGMAEAFYPLNHHPPILVPSALDITDYEVKCATLRKKIMGRSSEDKPNNNEGIYPADNELQKRLKAALAQLKPDIDAFQTDLLNEMSSKTVNDVQKEVVLLGEMEESTDDDDAISPDDEDIKTLSNSHIQVIEYQEKTLHAAIDYCANGTTLTGAKSDVLQNFLHTCPSSSEPYQRILQMSRDDEQLKIMLRHNAKATVELMTRCVINEDFETYKRYFRLFANADVAVQGMEAVLRFSKELMDREMMTKERREVMYDFMRFCMETCETSTSNRNVRLVALLIVRLLRDRSALAEDIFADVKPFVLKYSENRDCTALYTLITDLRNGREPPSMREITKTTMTTTTTSKGKIVYQSTVKAVGKTRQTTHVRTITTTATLRPGSSANMNLDEDEEDTEQSNRTSK